jgi:aspartyl-tRNA(Asn)/glutamyl-tRNA(Gln) amidotransferase subunit B
MAKDVFDAMWAGEGSANQVIEAKGLRQISDTGALEQAIDAVILAHPQQVSDYRGGKHKLMGFFVGQVMKDTGGKANPAEVNRILRQRLGD